VSELHSGTEARLGAIESRLGQTAKMLARTEKLLAPLPAAAVDQAAYSMMKTEVVRLEEALQSTQRQMLTMQTAKATRAELLDIHTAVHRFLFGHERPPPPQTPPPPASASLARKADMIEAAYARDAHLMQPEPPPADHHRVRPPRPSTARTRQKNGYSVAAGADASLLRRRPASARDGRHVVAAHPTETSAAGAGPRQLMPVVPGVGAMEPWSLGTTERGLPASDAVRASAQAAAGGFVEVTELTQLFEERGASQRRSAGGRPRSAIKMPGGRVSPGEQRLPAVAPYD
jgi:hypothetical protein